MLSLKAGGTGLNLTAASHVVLYDRWWNPAVEDQARDRAWRIGQTRTVVSHRLVCPGTVDERVEEVVAGKRHIAPCRAQSTVGGHYLAAVIERATKSATALATMAELVATSDEDRPIGPVVAGGRPGPAVPTPKDHRPPAGSGPAPVRYIFGPRRADLVGCRPHARTSRPSTATPGPAASFGRVAAGLGSWAARRPSVGSILPTHRSKGGPP